VALKIVNITWSYLRPNVAEVEVEVENSDDKRHVVGIDVEYRMGEWINPEMPGVFQPFYGCQLYVQPQYYVEHNVDVWYKICTNGRTLGDQHNILAAAGILNPGEVGTFRFRLAMDGSQVPPPPWKNADGPYAYIIIYLDKCDVQVTTVETKSALIKFAKESFKPPEISISGKTLVKFEVEKIDRDRKKIYGKMTVMWEGGRTLTNYVYALARLDEGYGAVGQRDGAIYFIVNQLKKEYLIDIGSWYGLGLPIGPGWSWTFPLEIDCYIGGKYTIELCGTAVEGTGSKVVVKPTRDCDKIEAEFPAPPKKPEILFAETYNTYKWGTFGTTHGFYYIYLEVLSGPEFGKVYLKELTEYYTERTVSVPVGGHIKIRPASHYVKEANLYEVPIMFDMPGRYRLRACAEDALGYWAFCNEAEVEVEATCPIIKILAIDMPDPLPHGEVTIRLVCKNFGTAGKVYANLYDFRYSTRGGEPEIYVYNWRRRCWEWVSADGYWPEELHYVWLGEISGGETFEIPVKLWLPGGVTDVMLGFYVEVEADGKKIRTDKSPDFDVPVTDKEREIELDVDVEPKVLIAHYGADIRVKIVPKPHFALPHTAKIVAYLEAEGRKAKMLEATATVQYSYDKWLSAPVPDLGLRPGKYPAKVIVQVFIGPYVRTRTVEVTLRH